MKPAPTKGRNLAFETWSQRYKNARSGIGACEEVLGLWAEPMPRNWKREDWAGELGFRKNAKDGRDKGEQRIERDLLSAKAPRDAIGVLGSGGLQIGTLHPLYQNAALVNQRRGQVIADVFGVLVLGKRSRPVMIEVKVGDHHPWYALVENLLQIRLARACEPTIRSIWERKWKGTLGRGVWGIVLAPGSYFANPAQKASLLASRDLLKRLKGPTESRIAFATSDKLPAAIQIIDSNWTL